MAYADKHDIGSNQEGLDGGTALNAPTDNGDYYTFNGINQGIYFGSDWGDESTIDGIKARFRIHDFNKVKEDAGTIWKSGGNANGIGIGIDLGGAGRVGIFGCSGGSLTKITIDMGLLEENVWYIMYTSLSKLTIQKESDSSGYTQTGTVNPANGSDRESIGYSYGNSPLGAAGVGSYFAGDIDYIEIYTDGSLSIPDLTAAVPAEITKFEFGSSRGGVEYQVAVNAPTDNGTYYTFDGTNQGLYSNQTASVSWGNETIFDIHVKFRAHDKAKGSIQTIWKSGGSGNGIAVGIDASGNLGIFGRSSSLTSIIFSAAQYSNDTWYILKASHSKVQLYDVVAETFIENTGTATPGNGTSYQSFGYSEHQCPISGGSGDQSYFDGDIADVYMWAIGDIPWFEAGWTGKICGVTNPSKINGIAVADISKVCGV